jgi:hypothetical protein
MKVKLSVVSGQLSPGHGPLMRADPDDGERTINEVF